MEFIDLHRQYDVIGSQIEQGIKKVISDKHFIMGDEVDELEDRLAAFTGRKYAFSCSNGTDALVIPLMALELKPTDAVFVPAFTFFASAESVSLAGGTPVFIDCDEYFNIDTNHLESVIKKTISDGVLNPKGIIPVDLFGLPANYKEIDRIAKKYNLFVLEDAAQGFGGVFNGKKCGSFGDVSATSFFPAKPLGCYGDGGAIFTDNENMAELIKSIRVHGQGKDRYDNIRIGINGRLDTLQAAVLLAKIKIFENELASRNKIASRYSHLLKDYFKTPQIPSSCTSAWAQYTLLAENEEQRNKIVKKMSKFEIPIMIYYAVPMHLQTAYKKLKYKKGDLPKSEFFSERVFSVPMHPYLEEKEIDFIAKCLISSVMEK